MNVKQVIVNADDDGIRFEFVESKVHSTTTPKIYFNELQETKFEDAPCGKFIQEQRLWQKQITEKAQELLKAAAALNVPKEKPKGDSHE